MRIIHDDVNHVISQSNWNADLIFMDPPDNLGLAYDGHVDKMPPEDYYHWITWLIGMAMHKAPVVWVSLYHEHDFEINYRLIRTFGGDFIQKKLDKFIWTFTFGQSCQTDCGSGYRFLYRIAPKDYNWDAEAIREPSWRLTNGDKRADPRGCVPLDVWEFPRVVGNSPERRSWHPTQHPIALYQRMLKLSGAMRGKFGAVDLFGGTGTMIRAVRELSFKNPLLDCAIIEKSDSYVEMLRSENPDAKVSRAY